jgi:hypothetical protein
MIIDMGKLSFWAGNIPLTKNVYVPRFSYFDGGCYWKVSLLWFKFLLELSGSKIDNKVYKEISKEELDTILSELK